MAVNAAAEGGGAPGKVPISGGGAADGAANLQMQQALSSLVQVLSSLVELIKNMPKSAVNGASGSGPEQQNAGQVAPGKGMPATKGGGCDMPAPLPLSGGGGAAAATPAAATAADTNAHAH